MKQITKRDFKYGYEIGKNNFYTHYNLSACKKCGKERWVAVGKNPTGLCEYCNAARNRKPLFGKDHPRWQGDNVGYEGVHQWVKDRFERPLKCSSCDKESKVDLANISGEYKRDISDWEWLCRKCHMTKDGRLEQFRNNAISLNHQRGESNYCMKGHPYGDDNVLIDKNGNRRCKICTRAKQQRHSKLFAEKQAIICRYLYRLGFTENEICKQLKCAHSTYYRAIYQGVGTKR